MKYTHAYLFTYCLWLLCTTRTELGSFNRDCVACKTENTYGSNPSQKKKLLNPALEIRSKIKVKLTCSPSESDRGEPYGC